MRFTGEENVLQSRLGSRILALSLRASSCTLACFCVGLACSQELARVISINYVQEMNQLDTVCREPRVSKKV